MTYLMGVDVSTHNSSDIKFWNPQTSYNKGAKYSFIKAGDGGSNKIPGEDYDFQRHWKSCNPIMPWGAYWFWRPEVDSISQANFFINIIRGLPFRLPIIVDVERNDYNYQPYVMADRLWSTLSTVKAAFPTNKIGIYTRMSFWNDSIKGVATRSFWKDFYLFAARYPEPQPNPNQPNPWWDGDYKPRVGEWTNWTFWQWTEELPGADWVSASAHIDGDYFNGDQIAFNNFIGVPTVEIPHFIYISISTGLNLIDVTTGVKYGLVPQGTKLVVDGSYTKDNILWYKVGKYYIDSRYVKPLI